MYDNFKETKRKSRTPLIPQSFALMRCSYVLFSTCIPDSLLYLVCSLAQTMFPTAERDFSGHGAADGVQGEVIKNVYSQSRLFEQ